MSSHLIKSGLSHIWSKTLHARNSFVSNLTKENINAEIYEKWMNTAPLILSCKLHIQTIEEESEQIKTT